MQSALITLQALAILAAVSAHGRWKCPLPRDDKINGVHSTFDNTANKYAACGPLSGQWGAGSTTTLTPGWNTLTWEESIAHTGSPFRIAILDETETARIVLLDHIPHNEKASPIPYLEASYVEYKMSVYVPNVACEKCSLQFLYVMTDKTVKCDTPTCYYNPLDAACKGSTDPAAATCAGAPNDNVCTAEGLCFSSYHSCTDVTITGTQPISAFGMDQQPADWPFKSMTMQYYGAEVGTWNKGLLSGVPSNYTTDFKSFSC
jgi:hypothetical protein